ncbi:hypothetical protein ACJIZ3_003796 [Penstemon smallii]|uniref:GRF-type domain-containing protein n=1 Tax=Penstemon smallii TaxID=265156 RepID=A0ABD3S0B7_9LAMI
MDSSYTSTGHSSSNGGRVEFPGRTCFCGCTVRMFTSRTSQNPGRRFLRCPKLHLSTFSYLLGEKCDFFEWVDQHMCDRAGTIIPGLLVRLNQLEDHNRIVEVEKNRLSEENRLLYDCVVQLQVTNNALRYKLKLVLICAICCLLAFVWFM